MTTASWRPQEGCYPLVEVVEGGPMFGKDDELLVGRWHERFFGHVRCSGKEPVEQGGEFLPLLVFATDSDRLRQRFQPP